MPHHLYVCQSATSWRDGNINSPLTWTGYFDIRNVLHIVGKTKSRHVWVVSSGDTPPPFLILGFLPGVPETCFRRFRITLSGKSHRGIQLFFAQAP